MKKSKILYLFNIIILVLVIIYSLNYDYVSKYDSEKEIIGTIIKITEKNNNVQYIIKAEEKLLVTCYDCKNTYKVGDIVRFNGYFQEVKSNSNFNLFDYNKYLKSLKIYKSFVFKESIYIENSNSFIYNSYNFLNDKISNLKSSYFLKAMILGNTNDFSESDYESYRNPLNIIITISCIQFGIFVIMTFIKQTKSK